MSWKAVASFLLALCSVITLMIYARPISEWLVGFFYQPKFKIEQPLVGQLLNVSGVVYVDRLIDGKKNTIQPKINEPLYHFDKIRTEKGSTATVEISGWQLALGYRSTVIIESYRPNDPSAPLLVTLSYGDYSVLKAGPPGSVYIAQDNKIFSPDSSNRALSSRQIEVKTSESAVAPEPTTTQEEASATVEKTENLNPLAPPALPTNTLPKATEAGKMPEKLKTGDEETLSNAYIESVLIGFNNEFRRCQINSLRDNQNIIGGLLLSLTIQPNGQATQIKILQNTTQNNAIADCSKSVLERARFRSFVGLPITLTYPLEFK